MDFVSFGRSQSVSSLCAMLSYPTAAYSFKFNGQIRTDRSRQEALPKVQHCCSNFCAASSNEHQTDLQCFNVLYSFHPSASLIKTKCQMESAPGISKIGSYKPQCDEQGRYKPMQCWHATGFCWCVDESGTVVEGTTMRGRPDCQRGRGHGSKDF